MAKAIRAIESHGVHSTNTSIAAALHEKHPVNANERRLNRLRRANPIQATISHRRGYARSNKHCDAQIPHRLRGRGIKFNTRSHETDGSMPGCFTRAWFPGLGSTILFHPPQGRNARRPRSYIMSAPLTPLRKPDGGVRPIAVGETLRRMVSSIAMSRVKAHAKHLLTPYNSEWPLKPKPRPSCTECANGSTFWETKIYTAHCKSTYEMLSISYPDE